MHEEQVYCKTPRRDFSGNLVHLFDRKLKPPHILKRKQVVDEQRAQSNAVTCARRRHRRTASSQFTNISQQQVGGTGVKNRSALKLAQV